MELRFDRFYRYPDLTAFLKGFCERHPRLFAIKSIGRSFEGRDLWVVTGDRGQCEWTLRAPRGSEVTVSARHDRAGRVAQKVVLG